MPDDSIMHSSGEKDYLIGLDLGTSAIKGVLISAKGDIVSKEKAQTRYISSENGLIEFDADEFYLRIVEVIHQLVKALPKDATIAGLSMASASGNTLLVDDAGKPMMNAISWMDTRVDCEAQTVFDVLNKAEIHEITGWPYLNIFPLAHLCWLKCHKPKLLQEAAKICMSTDYVNFKLTGEWGIESSTATTFYLQDQKKAVWYQPYLEKLGIPIGKLPQIKESGTILGHITSDVAAATGLSAGIPVMLGSFDHPCAARGSGVFDEGQLLLSCGTSWVGFYPLKNRNLAVTQKLLIDPYLQKDGLWGAMVSLGGISNDVDNYLRKFISAAPERYKEFDDLSSSSSIGAGGLLINPMQYDESNKLNFHQKADIARAIMEGTVYLLRMKIEQLQKAGMQVTSINMVGGPSETVPWPQMIADVLGRDVSIVNGSCAGAVGAAILAGIGAGLYANEREAYKRMNFKKHMLIPDEKAHKEYDRVYLEFVNQYPDTNL